MSKITPIYLNPNHKHGVHEYHRPLHQQIPTCEEENGYEVASEMDLCAEIYQLRMKVYASGKEAERCSPITIPELL